MSSVVRALLFSIFIFVTLSSCAKQTTENDETTSENRRQQDVVAVSSPQLAPESYSVPTEKENMERLKNVEEWKNIERLSRRVKKLPKKMDDRAQELYSPVFGSTDSDRAEAKRVGTDVGRLFPAGAMDRHFFVPDEFPPSAYCFCDISEYFAPVLSLDGNMLAIEMMGNYGYIAEIGDLPVESVTEDTGAVAALAKYESPFYKEKVPREITLDGYIYRDKAPLKIGATYVLRIIMYPTTGKIYVLRVLRRDIDKSVIILIKPLKSFDGPKIDQGMVGRVQKAIRDKGFEDITVGYDEQIYGFNLSGVVPKGKKDEVFGIAVDSSRLRPGSIWNGMVEK